jgi:hypothetical protein
MIDLTIRIENEEGTDKINVEVLPYDNEANNVEKDVLTGLFPHVVNLLNGLLGGEGFRKMEKVAQPVPETESSILDKNGAPTSIPMNEDYLRKKGLIEPEEGPEIRDKDSNIIID